MWSAALGVIEALIVVIAACGLAFHVVRQATSPARIALANQPPTAEQGIVMAGSADGQILAVRPSDGARYWSYRLNEGVSEVIIQNQMVYALAGQGDLYALRATDGALLWKQAPPPSEYATPSLLLSAGALLVTYTDGLHAVRASDGKTLWTTSRANVLATGDGMVFVGTQQFTPSASTNGASGGGWVSTQARDIEALRATDGSVVWRRVITATDSARPLEVDAGAVADHTLYIVGIDNAPQPSDRLEGLDTRDGGVIWGYPLSVCTAFLQAVDSERLYFGGQPVCAVSRTDGSQAWRLRSDYQLFVSDGGVYGTSINPAYYNTTIARLRPSDGAEMWRWQAPHNIHIGALW